MSGKLVLDGLQKAATLSLFAVTCHGAYTVGNGLHTLRQRRLAAANPGIFLPSLPCLLIHSLSLSLSLPFPARSYAISTSIIIHDDGGESSLCEVMECPMSE